MILKLYQVSTFGLAISLATPLLGVTTANPKENRFVKDPLKFRASLSLPASEKIKKVSVSQKILRARANRGKKTGKIEALHIKVPANHEEMSALANRLARPRHSTKLYDYFAAAYHNSTEKKRSDGSKRVMLTQAGVRSIDLSKLAKLYEKNHHHVSIDGRALRDDSALSAKLLKQAEPFISAKMHANLRGKIQRGHKISLEDDLLPSFARKMVGRFLVYRGPNCFHASLAFHGRQLTRSKYFNVKRENGYHNAMINYDELWRAIQANFYEIDVDKTPLKYGDMLVFFDVPKDAGDTYFRWIRHAATYLVGPYTFSKGSKSPDTPYTVKTLDEEWATWTKFSKNLGVKVFRRARKHVTKRPPMDPVDWLY